MTDFLGNELSIGDTVAITVSTSTRVSNLRKGIIKGFHKTAGYEVAEVHCNVQRNPYSAEFLWSDDKSLTSSKIVKI